MHIRSKLNMLFLGRAVFVTTILSVFGACANISEKPTPANPAVTLGGEQVPSQVSSQAFSFIVMGDTPYDDFGNNREKGTSKDQKMLADAVKHIKTDIKPPFVIHVGDTKKGNTKCSEYIYDRFAALVKQLAPIPVMYTPGDNEWVDCDRKGDSELAKLTYIRKRFYQTLPVKKIGNSPEFGYVSQPEQVENASWYYNQVQFATLHIPGTNNARNWVTADDLMVAKTSADLRDAANRSWLDTVFRAAQDNGARAVIISIQADIIATENNDPSIVGVPCQSAYDNGAQICDGFADFRKALAIKSVEFQHPVLLIHGDTPAFSLNQSFLENSAPNLWRLNGTGDGIADVTHVKVNLAQAVPFSASGLLTGMVPDS